jgi:speckle-type POZ protein
MLETSDYLKDDCLKINCTVGVVVSATNCSQLNSIQVPESDIGAHFGMMLDNMEGSDVIFNVGGEKFHAHKLVLSARSPFFRSKFFDGVEKDEKEIVISDLEPKVFKVITPKIVPYKSILGQDLCSCWFVFLYFFSYVIPYRLCCTLFTEILSLKT